MFLLRLALVSLFISTTSANPRICQTQIEHSDSKLILANDLSLYRNTQYANSSLQYYASTFSIGIQSINIRLSGDQVQNYESDTYFNASKKFDLTEQYAIEIGGMLGTNFNSHVQQLHAAGYTDIGYTINPNLSIAFGSYYVNDVLATKHQPFNVHAGLKYKIDDFVFTGDYFSGNNNLSGANVNVFYKITPNIRPYIGVQIPEKNSGNEFAGTIGISVKLN